MKLLLKQKLKEQLQRTQDKQQETKKGRILCLEAIGEGLFIENTRNALDNNNNNNNNNSNK